MNDGIGAGFKRAIDPENSDGFFTQQLQDRDPNLINDFVTAIPTPQTITEGTNRKTQRGVNFTREEDKILVSGWLSTSLDAIVGNDKKSTTFWSRVHQYYHECKKPNFQERTIHSLTNRWSAIQRSVNKFCACLAQIENLHQSGHTENDKIKLAKASYKENENNEFIFGHCWDILRYQPKWILQKEQVQGKKKKITCASSSTPETINLGDEDISPISPHWERPQGRKAQKDQEKKRKHKEGKSTQLETVVERITNDKKQLHDEKMAKLDMLAEIEKEKIKLKTEVAKEKVKQKDRLITMAEEERNEKIMLMDISGLDAVQQEYIKKRRLQILQNFKI